jgi:pyridoxamine 5'-phosphate oxidase
MNDLNEHIRNLRKDYAKGILDEHQVHPDPLKQFGSWFHEALKAELEEPYAMTLATVDATGQPSARVVLLRGFDERGFMFFTNYQSRKGQDLAANPKASLLFHWAELERQIRIEGMVEMADAHDSDKYFLSRPRESRIGAWASPQSQVIQGREELENLLKQRVDMFEGTEVNRPAHWGGYVLRPSNVEFWQGRPSRLHDRVRYKLQNGLWAIERLAP